MMIIKSFIKIILPGILLYVFFNAANGQKPLWKTLPIPPAMPKADVSGLAPVNGIKMYYAIFNEQGKEPVILFTAGL